MTDMSFPDFGQAAPVGVPAGADPATLWALPDAPLAMPVQVLERPRVPLTVVLAGLLRGPRRPDGAVG